ncbi:MAG: glycosyltransferase family 2 protein [Chlamydiales bacterium]
MEPNLSIFIPCYNYGKYLSESIDSVLSQNYSQYEILLIDDGSTDETAKLGQSYSDKYPHIFYIRNPRNLGLFETCKIALKRARGAYFHFFSADDRYLPGFLSKSMGMLKEHPHLNLVCSTVSYFDDGSPDIRFNPLIPNCSKNTIFNQEELLRLIHKTDFFVPGTSCIVRRNLIDHYGGFDPKLENIADWFLFHKIAFSEGLGYLPDTLISMRVHETTLTNMVKKNKHRRRATFHRLLDHLLGDQELRKKFIYGGLLDFVFRDLKWKLYLYPKYLPYWKYIRSHQ